MVCIVTAKWTRLLGLGFTHSKGLPYQIISGEDSGLPHQGCHKCLFGKRLSPRISREERIVVPRSQHEISFKRRGSKKGTHVFLLAPESILDKQLKYQCNIKVSTSNIAFSGLRRRGRGSRAYPRSESQQKLWERRHYVAKIEGTRRYPNYARLGLRRHPLRAVRMLETP